MYEELHEFLSYYFICITYKIIKYIEILTFFFNYPKHPLMHLDFSGHFGA